MVRREQNNGPPWKGGIIKAITGENEANERDFRLTKDDGKVYVVTGKRKKVGTNCPRGQVEYYDRWSAFWYCIDMGSMRRIGESKRSGGRESKGPEGRENKEEVAEVRDIFIANVPSRKWFLDSMPTDPLNRDNPHSEDNRTVHYTEDDERRDDEAGFFPEDPEDRRKAKEWKEQESIRHCQQCQGEVRLRNGSTRRCKLRTCKYSRFCHHHSKRRFGTRLGPSSIPGAGTGLFAIRDFGGPKGRAKTGEVLAEYGDGRFGLTLRSARVNDPRYRSNYLYLFRKGYAKDGKSTQSGLGRYANMCRAGQQRARLCRGNNAAFAYNRGSGKVTLRSKRRIRRGEEIFVSYGREFFKDTDRENRLKR